MSKADTESRKSASYTAISILIFAVVVFAGLALILYGDGTNTGFVYGNV